MQFKNMFSSEHNVCSAFMEEVKDMIMIDHTILYKPTVWDYIKCGSVVALLWFIKILAVLCVGCSAFWAIKTLIKHGIAWYWIAAIVLYIVLSVATGICAKNKARAKADKDE